MRYMFRVYKFLFIGSSIIKVVGFLVQRSHNNKEVNLNQSIFCFTANICVWFLYTLSLCFLMLCTFLTYTY